jgi:hypothetical protein
LVVFAFGYSTLSGILAWWAATEQARPIVPQAVLATGLLAFLSGTGGALSFRYGGLRQLSVVVSDLASQSLARVLPSVGVALGVHLLASLVVLVGLIAAGYSRVVSLHQALHPDAVGGIMLVLGQLMIAPNLVLWVSSVLAGPGFSLGTDSAVNVHETVLGPLPALPVLGSLPDPGPFPSWTVVLLAVPVLAGVAAGARLLRATQLQWWRLPFDLLAVAALSGVMMTVLTWLSAGPAGPGRLSWVGPQAIPVGAWFAGEVFVGLLLALVILRLVPALFGLASRWSSSRARESRAVQG